MTKRALLLINRRARHGDQSVDAVIETLSEHGVATLEVAPREPETLADVVLRHQADVDMIILGGGDGTLNAAVDALVVAQLPVGILPLGTANDLARTLRIPCDPIEACRVIAGGRTMRIDLGEVNGKHFFNVASIGLSVAITRELTREVKRVWGVLAYLRSAIHAVYHARPFRAEIRAAGQVFHVKSVQIAIGNGRHYGGGMTIREDAAIDDHLLDLYSLEIQRWWQILWLLPRLRTGTLAGSRYARTMRGAAFEVVTRVSRRINTDGEITGRTPGRFRIVPDALTVFVPEDADRGVGSRISAVSNRVRVVL